MGMTGLCLADLFLERADRLAIVAGGDRRHRRLQRTGFLDALGPHVFEKLRPDLVFARHFLNSTKVICVDSGNRCAASCAGVSLITMLVLDGASGIEDTLRHTQDAEVGLPGRAAR